MQSTKEPKTIKVGGERRFKFITDFSSFDVDCYNEAIEAINAKDDFVEYPVSMPGNSLRLYQSSRFAECSDRYLLSSRTYISPMPLSMRFFLTM